MSFTALVFSPKLVLLNNTDMKVLNSIPISSFGGLNFVLEEFQELKLKQLIISELQTLPKQSQYSWYDILTAYWSVFLCGGDCAEDLSVNLRHGLANNPFLKIPSPDRVLERLKSLSTKPVTFTNVGRGNSEHLFSVNTQLNKLNLRILKRLSTFKKQNNILDYDNTLIHCKKSDASYTYKKELGYCPGVGMIGKHVVYVENRNGNCAPQTLQEDTFSRMRNLFKEEGITIDTVRADSASYSLKTITEIKKFTKTFFIRARMSSPIERAISAIEQWEKVRFEGKELWRASIRYTPFKKAAQNHKIKDKLEEYRLVITKEKRDDGQINMFTGEAYNYSAIVTNDIEMSNDQVVFFYNARGTEEKVFDELKNDFGWYSMPFSKLEQNTVFLLITAMCKNLFHHILSIFSLRVDSLEKHFRIKKFIYRFICIPAKWVKSGRTMKLRIYGEIKWKT